MTFGKKNLYRSMAESERMMDEGKIPWVLAPNMLGTFDRLAVSPSIMVDLGLEQGQKVNTHLLDAIAEMSHKILIEKLDDIIQEQQDSLLDPNFDFRSMM